MQFAVFCLFLLIGAVAAEPTCSSDRHLNDCGAHRNLLELHLREALRCARFLRNYSGGMRVARLLLEPEFEEGRSMVLLQKRRLRILQPGTQSH